MKKSFFIIVLFVTCSLSISSEPNWGGGILLIPILSVYNYLTIVGAIMLSILVDIMLLHSFLYWATKITPSYWRRLMNWKMSPSLSVTRMAVFSTTTWSVASPTTTCSCSRMMSLKTCSPSSYIMAITIYMVNFEGIIN